jgi:hypothetical protein
MVGPKGTSRDTSEPRSVAGSIEALAEEERSGAAGPSDEYTAQQRATAPPPEGLTAYYDLLGLEPGTPPGDVRRAYSRLAGERDSSRIPAGSELQREAADQLQSLDVAFDAIRATWPESVREFDRAFAQAVDTNDRLGVPMIGDGNAEALRVTAWVPLVVIAWHVLFAVFVAILAASLLAQFRTDVLAAILLAVGIWYLGKRLLRRLEKDQVRPTGWAQIRVWSETLGDRWRLMHFGAKAVVILFGFLGVFLASSGLALGLPFIAVALGVAYFSGRSSERRRAELVAVAHGLGWRFDPGFKSGKGPPYSYFEAFSIGDFNVKAYNTIEGSLEIGGRAFPVAVGDFTTTRLGSKSSTEYRFSYILLEVPFSQVPDLVIRPEGLMDRIGAAIGFEDIDFESAEFSRRFHVTSSEKRFAYDVIHARMMEFLLARRPPQLSLSRGYFCIVEPYGKPWTPTAFGSHLELAQSFFDLWPEYLISEYS